MELEEINEEKLKMDEHGNILYKYAKEYIGIERNNHGHSTLNTLENTLEYDNLFHMFRYNTRTKQETEKLGWETTSQSKFLMLDELDTSHRNEEIVILDEKTSQIMEAYERYSDGIYHYYEVTGEDQFQYPDRNLKIAFNETNRGSRIIIQTIDYMGMTNSYEIFAGFFGLEFEDNEIKPGKIYSFIYQNYQFYLAE